MKITRYSLRAAVAAVVLAGTAAVPAAAFASDSGSGTPAEHATVDGAAVAAPDAPDADGGAPDNPVTPDNPGTPDASTPAPTPATDNAKTQGEDDTGKIKPGPATTVTLGNGALATVQNVNGSYTAKIQVANKEIATLSATHPTVTFDGVRYTLAPKDGKVGIAYLHGKEREKREHREQQHQKHGGKDAHRHGHGEGRGHQQHQARQQHTMQRAAVAVDRGERQQHAADGAKTPKGAVAAGEAVQSGTDPAVIAGGVAAAAALAGGGLLVARRGGGSRR